MSELKNYVVPLAHDTLSKDEVAARCIAAAEKKGCEANGDPYFSYEEAKKWTAAPVSHFDACSSSVYTFHNHDCQELSPNTLTTLEAFEEYCWVTDEAKRQTIDQRIAELEHKLDQLAHIVAEKLQEPKEEAKTEGRVVIDGLFRFSGEMTILNLPDESQLWIPPALSWTKRASDGEYTKHTLVNVEKHTVGKFYLLKDGEPNDFDDYALCLSDVNLVAAQEIAGVVTIHTISRDQVSLQEVQPLNK